MQISIKQNRSVGLIVGCLLLSLLSVAEEAEPELVVDGSGDTDIESGISAVERGDYWVGVELLRSGIERSPTNLEGRTALAEVLNKRFGRRDLAAETLVSGIKHGGIEDYQYLRGTLRFLLNHQMHDSIRSINPSYLHTKEVDSGDSGAIAYTLAHSYYLTEDYAASLQYLENFGVQRSLEGQVLRARIHWEQGNRAKAFSLLNAALEVAGRKEASDIFRLIVDYQESQGDLRTAVLTAKLWRLRAPVDSLPRIQLFRLLHKQGDTERAAREARKLIEQFSQNEDAMRRLANQAAELGDADLARELYSIAEDAGFETEMFALMRVEADVASGAYAEAIASVERILAEKPRWSGRYRAMLQAFRVVAECGKEGSGRIGEDLKLLSLNDSLGPTNFSVIARHMKNVNCFLEAALLLEAGLERFPENHELDASLRRLSADR